MIKYSPKNIQTQIFKIIILVAKTTKEQIREKENQEFFPQALYPNHIKTKSEALLTLEWLAQGRPKSRHMPLTAETRAAHNHGSTTEQKYSTPVFCRPK